MWPGDTKSSYRWSPTLHLQQVEVPKADQGKEGVEGPSTGDQRLQRAQTRGKQQGVDLVKGRKKRAQGRGTEEGGGSGRSHTVLDSR